MKLKQLTTLSRVPDVGTWLPFSEEGETLIAQGVDEDGVAWQKINDFSGTSHPVMFYKRLGEAPEDWDPSEDDFPSPANDLERELHEMLGL